MIRTSSRIGGTTPARRRRLSTLILLSVVMWAGACGTRGSPSEDAGAGRGPVTTERHASGRREGGGTEGRTREIRGGGEPESSASSRGSGGCGGRPPALGEDRTFRGAIDSAGGRREYLVHVPTRYRSNEPLPVVFDFHGMGSNKEQQLLYSQLVPLADSETFLVVAPDALGRPRAWSPFGVVFGEARDLDFFRDLLEAVERTFCVDPTRVYATGMSSGGFMSSAVACEYSHLVAAVAPVTATYWREPECGEALPTPYVYFHGTDDPVVRYWGPSGTAPPGGGTPHGSAPYNAQLWADHNGCDGYQDERISDEVVLREWSGCDAPTYFYTIIGGGHTWPGSIDVERLGLRLGRTTQDIRASHIIWDLFRRSERPEATAVG